VGQGEALAGRRAERLVGSRSEGHRDAARLQDPAGEAPHIRQRVFVQATRLLEVVGKAEHVEVRAVGELGHGGIHGAQVERLDRGR